MLHPVSYILHGTFIMLHLSWCIHHIAFSVLHSSYDFIWFHRHWHAQDRNCIWDWFHVTFITALARIFPTFLSAPTIIQLCAQHTVQANCPLSLLHTVHTTHYHPAMRTANCIVHTMPTVTSAYCAPHNTLSSNYAHSQLHTVHAQYNLCSSYCLLRTMPNIIMLCTHISAYRTMLSFTTYHPAMRTSHCVLCTTYCAHKSLPSCPAHT